MDPVTDSGNRVTRSLRKRISSVDSENSSRPGTPVPSKLTAITETNSPSRPIRATRRNSTSGVATPVKTPAKRTGAPTSAISETTECVTPARRTTRRRSVSINENESTPQTSIKAPVFETLPEEIIHNKNHSIVRTPQKIKTLKSPDQIVSETKPNSPDHVKTTEIQSTKQMKLPEEIKKNNSPEEQPVKKESKSAEKGQINSSEERKKNRRRKPGPKCMTRVLTDELDDLSDVEVIVVEKEERTENNIKINPSTINLIDDDDNDGNEPQKSENFKLVNESPKTTEKGVTLTNTELETHEKTDIDQNITTVDLMECDDTLDTTDKLSAQEIQENDTIIDLMECDDEQILDDIAKEVAQGVQETVVNIVSESSISVSEENKQKIPQADSSLMNVKEALLNESECKENSTEENLCSKKSERKSQIESDKNDTLFNSLEPQETPPKETSDNQKPSHEIAQIKTVEYKVDNSATKETLNNRKLQEPSPIIQETLKESKSEEILTNETLDTKNQKETTQVECSKIINETLLKESKIEEIPVQETSDNQKLHETPVKETADNQETLKVDCSIVINETLLNNSKSEDILTKESLDDQNEQEKTSQTDCSVIINETLLDEFKSGEIHSKDDTHEKSGITLKINDETIDSTKFDLNSNDLDCTTAQTDEKITSITINDESIGNASKLDVEENAECLTPNPRNLKPTIIEVINITPDQVKCIESGDCKSSKKVDFFMSPSGDKLKNVYPKTPALMKTKSSLECYSFPNAKSSSTDEENTNSKDVGETNEQTQKFQKDKLTSTSAETNEMETDDSETVIVQNQAIGNFETKTSPQKLICVPQMQLAERPIQTTNDAQKLSEDEVQQEEENKSEELNVSKSPNKKMSNFKSRKQEQQQYSIDNEISSITKEEIEIKWINPSVRGNTTEGSKLDAVVKPTETPKKQSDNEEGHEIEEEVNKSQMRKCNAIVFSSESEDNEEESEREYQDDDEEEELAIGEKPFKRAHPFHDDEAMEVEDYESGDSMDSEERREMLENEIPIDGESIGSNTTDEDNDDRFDEGEESGNDSFIVSDNEEEENLHLECSEEEDSDDEDDFVDNSHERKKKTFKRIQRPAENSSSSSEEEEEERDEIVTEKKSEIDSPSPSKQIIEPITKSGDSNILDTSKLSDTALRLKYNVESESESELDEQNARNENLLKLNQSDRFNKSVRDLNPEIDTSPIEQTPQTERHSTSIRGENKDPLQNSKYFKKSMANEDNEDESQADSYEDKEETSSTDEEDSLSCKSPSDKHVKEQHKLSGEKQTEFSHLGDVSVTTESDNDKENASNKNKLSSSIRMQLSHGLSVSFGGNFKKPKHQSTQKRRSFTIGVSLKGGDIETEVKQTKDVVASGSPSTSATSSPNGNAEQDDDGFSSDDARFLENLKHMPLGHPLVRTRRQSLALPTNPDMEICSSSHGVADGNATIKKPKRKSLGLPSGNDFNPSQSFIDSIALRRNEFERQATSKRKRLSKSFCGAADTMDSSIIDIDVRHLHKRSKLSADNSLIDSMENINTSKLSSRATHSSSTPREKSVKNDSNNNIQRILSRCDEILEAANRAKLKDKLHNKKNKVKPQKKNRKRTAQQEIRELHQNQDGGDHKPKSVAKEIKSPEKTKAALAQALKAANVIINKKKQKYQKIDVGPPDTADSEDSKHLSPDILEAVVKSERMPKKNKNKTEINNGENKLENCHITSTTAGSFIDMPQTPEKKKKTKFIQLPTGKVCVEPITPKHRAVLAGNGTVFHESPITPLAVGFKVRQIPCDDGGGHHASILKNRKRKRNFDESTNRYNLPKPQWTQSGLFIEEEIPTMRRIAKSEDSQSTSGFRRMKKCQTENENINAHWNFKEIALMRNDIKRITNREVLHLKERRQMQSH